MSDGAAELMPLRPDVDTADTAAIVLPSAAALDVDKLRDREGKRARRRAIPIQASVGANGSGKSLQAVHDLLPSIASGRLVLSTVRLLEPGTRDMPKNVELINSWPQLLEAEHCDVFLDEIVGIASSREHQGMPTSVANILMQLRRRDVTLRWTAPNWARADKLIREVTQGVTLCSGMLSKAPELRPGDPDVRTWRENRLFLWQTYDAQTFDEFTIGKSQAIKPQFTEWFWRPGSRAMHAYDTLGAVERIGDVLDSGRCAHCGGRRTIPLCKCSHHEPEAAHGAPAGAGGR